MGQDEVDAHTQEPASTGEKLAESEEDLEDPEEFLAMLKERCSGTDAEWEERQLR